MKTVIDESLERRLLAYADGELDDTDRLAVETHLDGDPVLRQRLADYRHSLEYVKTGLLEPPALPMAPPELVLRLRVRRHWHWRLALAGCAVAGIVVLAAIFLIQPAPSQPVAPVASVEPPYVDMTDSSDEELAALRARIAHLEREIDRLQTAQAEAMAEQTARSVVTRSYREEVAAISVAAGEKHEKTFGDTATALQRYRFVAETYPDTSAADAARARIAQLDPAIEL